MTTLQDVITNAWARRNGYGPFAELDDIDPCLVDEQAESVGCAFGSGTIEDDEIPLADAVQTCHNVARKIEAIG